MRTKSILLLILSLLTVSLGYPQKRKKASPPAKTKIVRAEPAKPAAPTIGTTVSIITKNGDKLKGELVDITAFSVRFKADNLVSTLPLESIATLSFGTPRGNDQHSETLSPPVGEGYRRDATVIFNVFQQMATETKGGSSYTDYDRQLVQLRRTAEKFLQKYSATENPTEARALSLFTGALLDYNAARTIWTLKIGTNGTLAETDSPVVADTLAIYPEIRESAASGNKFSADKLIGNLWKKATEKVNLVQAMMK
jgi:hypothetical protein